MQQKMSISEAREQFTQLSERFAQDPGLTVQVEKRGEPVMVVVSYEYWDSLIETMAVLWDEETTATLKRGIADMTGGRVRDWEDVKAELGIDL